MRYMVMLKCIISMSIPKSSHTYSSRVNPQTAWNPSNLALWSNRRYPSGQRPSRTTSEQSHEPRIRRTCWTYLWHIQSSHRHVHLQSSPIDLHRPTQTTGKIEMMMAITYITWLYRLTPTYMSVCQCVVVVSLLVLFLLLLLVFCLFLQWRITWLIIIRKWSILSLINVTNLHIQIYLWHDTDNWVWWAILACFIGYCATDIRINVKIVVDRCIFHITLKQLISTCGLHMITDWAKTMSPIDVTILKDLDYSVINWKMS